MFDKIHTLFMKSVWHYWMYPYLEASMCDCALQTEIRIAFQPNWYSWQQANLWDVWTYLLNLKFPSYGFTGLWIITSCAPCTFSCSKAAVLECQWWCGLPNQEGLLVDVSAVSFVYFLKHLFTFACTEVHALIAVKTKTQHFLISWDADMLSHYKRMLFVSCVVVLGDEDLGNKCGVCLPEYGTLRVLRRML